MGSRRDRALRRLRVWGRLRARRRVRLALVLVFVFVGVPFAAFLALCVWQFFEALKFARQI